MCVLLIVLIAGACSSTDNKQGQRTTSGERVATDGSESSSSPDGTASGSKGDASSRGLTAAGSVVGRSPARRASISGPVVIAKGGTIKIGAIVDTGNPGAAFGVAADFGTDNGALVQAMADELNATGGVAGRKVRLAVREADQTDQSSATQTRIQNEICTNLTEDEKVFVVLSFSANGLYGRSCYARHGTPFYDTGGIFDDKEFRDLGPWLLPAMAMTPNQLARLMPIAFADGKLLTKKMGLIGFDDPLFRRTGEKILIPGINARGGKLLESVWLPVDYQSLASGIASAVLRFQQKGIDRVVMWAPGGGAWLLFARQAESQQYRPRYGISTLDVPRFVGPLLPEAQLRGSLGPGYFLARDISDSQQPPPTAKEKACWKVMQQRAGRSFSQRSAGADPDGLNYCDDLYLLRTALEPAATKALNRTEIAAFYGRLGRRYAPIRFPRSSFQPGRTSGISDYRSIAYDTACGCFKYASGWKEVPF